MAGISVVIGANTDDLDSAIRRSRSNLAGLGSEMRGSITTAAKWGAGISIAATAAGAAIVSGSLKSIDALAKTSDKLGIAVSDLQALRQAAELTGVGTSTLDMSLQRMTRRLSEAAKGTGEAQDALKELNLDAVALAKLSPDEQFKEIAGAMEGVGAQSDRVRLAFKLFDSEGAALVNTLALGKQGLNAVGDEMDALGASITRVDAAKVEAANDAMLRVATAVGAVGDRLAIELAPIIDAVSRMMVEAGTDGVNMGEAIAEGFNSGIKAASFVIDAVEGVKRTFEIAGKVIALFGLGVADVMLTAADAIINSPVRAINELIEAMNQIPSIDIDAVSLSGFGAGIERELKTVRTAAAIGIQDIQDTLLAPMPGMQFEQFVAESKANALAAAKDITGITDMLKPDIGEGGGESGGSGGRGSNTEGDSEENDETSVGLTAEEIILREEEKATLKREKMIEAFEQEKELIKDFNIQLAELRDLKEDSDTVSEDEYQQARLDKMRDFFRSQFDIQSGGLDALGDLSSKFFGAETAMAVDALGNILNAFSGNSKKIFKIQKAAGIANAIVSTFRGASKALELGWPLGPIAAASITATGFAKVAAIKSTTMGGGGSGGGGGGGGASLSSGGQGSADQSEPVKPPTETMVANLNITGQNFDRRTVIGLVEQINDLQEDGMRIRLNTV